MQAKYTAQTAKIKERFDSLGVTYKGTPQSGGLISSNPVTTASSYFYHSDHLGSSSLITDQLGSIIQHLEYIPFGDTFIDERQSLSSWHTPNLFNAKERDEETGLTYFGARYYDSRTSIWLSVDPLAEKRPWMSPYVYCSDNPVNRTDPDGRWDGKPSEKNKVNGVPTAPQSTTGFTAPREVVRPTPIKQSTPMQQAMKTAQSQPLGEIKDANQVKFHEMHNEAMKDRKSTRLNSSH